MRIIPFICLPSPFRCFSLRRHQSGQRQVRAESGAAQRVRRRDKVRRERARAQVDSGQRGGYGGSDGWCRSCISSSVCCLRLQCF